MLYQTRKEEARGPREERSEGNVQVSGKGKSQNKRCVADLYSKQFIEQEDLRFQETIPLGCGCKKEKWGGDKNDSKLHLRSCWRK